MTTNWNPAQYNKFKAQRAKPFYDLLALIQIAQFNAGIDLGCGTGELTRVLFDRLKPTQFTGIDSSAEMLAKSLQYKTSGLAFERQDIASIQLSRPLDLLFSNAALHWVPHHEMLFPKLLQYVAPDGQVAIQMPFNFDHASHRLAHQVAARLFPALFSAEHPVSATLLPDRYAEIMYENGFEDQVCRVEVYGHPMPSGSEVVEWTRGSLLTKYQEKLTPQQFEVFLNQYRAALLQVIGEGPYFYTFKRILLWGRKRT